MEARQSPNANISRLEIQNYDWGLNCIHGVQSMCGTHCATSFPSPNALGATFNRDIWLGMAQVIGVETRALWLEGFVFMGVDVTDGRRRRIPHVGPALATDWTQLLVPKPRLDGYMCVVALDSRIMMILLFLFFVSVLMLLMLMMPFGFCLRICRSGA